ncbi:MAG TPA: MFS transporter [Aeromicrobium sp.]|nr:MFS transporter [Aeromicrobium sp.]
MTTTVAKSPRIFTHLLANTAVANVTTSYLWFALIFWVYLETRSVLANGVIGGAYMLFVALGSILFGSFVDHHRKLHVMRSSAFVTLAAFAVCAGMYLSMSNARLLDLGQPWFWLFTAILLAGAVVEQLRNIALSTVVTILVPDGERAKANGLVGTVQGLALIVTSVFSGLSIGFLGMGWTIAIALVLTAVALVHLFTLDFPDEELPERGATWGASIDLRGSIGLIVSASGLMALIVFSTFNNLIGGSYLALMDPYALELMSVQAWGLAFAFASTGFIVGGALVAKFGLGANPVRTLLFIIVAMGVIGMGFVARESVWLYVLGIWIYMALFPAAEAAEQTVIQRVVPLQRQGRVFGFAMAVESAATPVTAFIVAPLAQFWIIPWAKSASGRRTLEPWLGAGDTRGIAVVLVVAGLIMAVVALLAFLTPAYRQLVETYRASAPAGTTGMETAGA